MTERTDMARFRSGHHPALRRWQHLVGISEDASADCVVIKLNLQNTYGYDVQRFLWNDTIATMAIRWTNSSSSGASVDRSPVPAVTSTTATPSYVKQGDSYSHIVSSTVL